MLKRNKLLLGILVLLLVLSVGYALFSEKIVIDGTIKATGDFEITADCEKGYGVDLVNAGVASSADYNQNGFEGDICSVDGTNVTLSTGLKYPGAKRYFTVKMTPTGAIGAKIGKTHEADLDFYSVGVDTGVIGVTIGEDGSRSEHDFNLGRDALINYINDQGINKEEKMADVIDVGVFIDGNYCSYKDSCFENFSYIDVGESIYYTIEFSWPEDFAEATYDEYIIKYNIDVPFEQITLSEREGV